MSELRKKEKISFRKSIVSLFHMAQVITRMTRLNLPSFVCSRLILTLQPFVALFFSARILNVLVSGAERNDVIRWVIVAVVCNYGLYLLERLIACFTSIEGTELYWKLYQEMARTMMWADYREVEGSSLRLAKERINRASSVYFYGPWELPGVFMALTEGILTTVCAIAFALPILQPVRGERFPWGIFTIAVFVAAAVWYSARSEKKLYEMKEESMGGLAEEYTKLDYLEEYADEKKGAKDIRLYRQQGLIMRQYARISGKIQKYVVSKGDFQAGSNAVQAVIAQAVSCLAYVMVGMRALAGLYPVGSIVQYVGAITRLSEGIRMLAYSVQHIRMQGPHCQEYLDFIGEGEDPLLYRHEQSRGEPVDVNEGSVFRFEHVGFCYPGTDRMVLQDLNIELRKGERMAVVGMNGSGKTTFIKLLCRLYNPTEGRILLNGQDIREFDQEGYWKLFSVVFQDFQLLALPLGENVAASETYDKARVSFCLEQAGIGDWARALPKGLRQPLYRMAEDGVNVSGGEAQKIAIARALYKDAPFVVLDEPTAALDPLAEAEIYERFSQLVAGKGAIYISHRLSSCRFCDRIAVFHEGRLIQLGTHEELYGDRKGKYYELWEAQAQYYREAK